MEATLPVYNRDGRPTRDVLIPGRSPHQPFGALRFASNVARRRLHDTGAILAALAAGRLTIALDAYEADTLAQSLGGRLLPYGGDVQFDVPRAASWELIEGDSFCELRPIAVPAFPCRFCGDVSAETALELGRHVRNAHRAERDAEKVAEAAVVAQDSAA